MKDGKKGIDYALNKDDLIFLSKSFKFLPVSRMDLIRAAIFAQCTDLVCF